MSDVREVDAGELRELGLLQEINRLFLHPRGFTLEYSNSRKKLVVVDCRDLAGGPVIEQAKVEPGAAACAEDLRTAMYRRRVPALGWEVQPLEVFG